MERIQTRGGPGKIEAILKGAGYTTEVVSDSPPRFYEAWTTPPTNYVGTALFLSYIAAALYSTYFIITKDIFPRWRQARDPLATTKMKLLVCLAAISFSILSFNMISFLLDSFNQNLMWATLGNGMETGIKSSIGYTWSWMLNTSLFYDFAKDLLVNDDVLYWTRQALSVTLIIGLDMSSQGTKYNLKSLWAYFMLAQILPPTFSWLLLQIRISVPAEMEDEKKQAPEPELESDTVILLRDIIRSVIGAVAIFAAMSSLYQLGYLRESPEAYSPYQFIWQILRLRLLFFAPFILGPNPIVHENLKIVYPALVVFILSQCTTAVQVYSGRWHGTMDWTEVLETLAKFHKAAFANWAVSTLSCDWILWMVGGFALRKLEG